MPRLLRQANLAVRLAGVLQRKLRLSRVERIERRYAQVVAAALAYREAQPPLESPRPKRQGHLKCRLGHSLALRLRNRRESVLRFLHEPAVPFTNNQAKQDVRMRKVRQKISHGFRSKHGRAISPPCAACSRVRGRTSATASRPCCKSRGPLRRSPSLTADRPLARARRE